MFAYGSNMLLERLAVRIDHLGPIKVVGTYVLQNYEMLFNAGGQFANIRPCPGAVVEGVLYELNHTQMVQMDWYERLYERQYTDIIYQGQPYILCTYVCVDKRSLHVGKPLLPYLNFCLDGALENGLKATYNKLLEYKHKNYKLKKSKHILL